MDIDLSEEDSDYEEDREWDTLLTNKTTLVDYLAELCPAYVGLHEGRLENNVWENLKGTHEDRRDQYLQKQIESFNEVYTKVMDTFKGQEVIHQFLSIPLRESEESHVDVLEDFWADHRRTWMHVANGDARDIIKPLKESMELEVMAKVHKKISMSCINMTELASTILAVDKPDVYAISRCIDEMKEQHYPPEDDAMMWNFPAANDVLKHLARCYQPE